MAKNIEPHVSSIEQVTIIGSNSVASTTNRVLCIFAADCGPLEPTEINSQSEFLRVYTEGGAISRKAHRSFLHALKASQSMPLLCVRVTDDKVTKGITNLGVKIATKGDKVLSYESTTDVPVVFNSKTKSDLVFAIGDIIFCSPDAQGTTAYNEVLTKFPDAVPVVIENEDWSTNLTKDDVADFMMQCSSYLMKYSDMAMDVVVGDTAVTIDAVYGTEAFAFMSALGVAFTEVDTQSAIGQANFILSPVAPSKTDMFEAVISDVVEIVKADNTYYRFNLALTARGETNSYALSTYPDDVDATGSNMYIESFNELNSDVKIIPVNDTAAFEDKDGLRFGSSGKIAAETSPETLELTLLNEAIALVEELEGIRISILFDCGLVQPAYQLRLVILAEALKAIAVLSTPDSTLIPYVIKYVNGVGLDARSAAWWGFPWNVDKTLVDFPVNLSAGCYYIERIAGNASGNQEFAPVFGKKTGICSGKNLRSNPTLDQRNQLQEANINPIKYSKVDNVAFFTNDLTTLKALNVLQEEQTRRLINKIRYEVDLLCESYLSYDWDQASCDAITSGIKNYFDNSIKTMLRTIDGDPIISVTLNGLNKVKVEVSVKPKGSIKYINVYYNILSMAS